MSKARSLADLISGGATIEASEIADSTITGGKLASDITINTTGSVTTTKISGPSYTNLTNYSEEFDNAFWTKTRASISANATIAPNGTTTADSLIESTDNNTHYVNKTISSMVTLADGDKITLSVYAKAGTRDHLFLSFNWSNGNNTAGVSVFDLSNGTISNTASNHDNVVMEDVGEGWYRCSITDTHDVNNAPLTFRCDIGIASGDTTFFYTGDGSSNIYIWGASFSLSDRPIGYIKTVTSSEAETETYVETDNFNVNSGALYIDTENRKVGIGTSTPSSTLDVNGNLTLSGNIIDSQNNDTIEILQNDIKLNLKHVVAGFGVGIRGNRGSVLGMDYSSALGVTSLALNTSGTQRMTISSGGDISFYEDTGTTAKLYWDASTEKLGIGTTSPETKLDVAGLTESDIGLQIRAGDGYTGGNGGTQIVFGWNGASYNASGYAHAIKTRHRAAAAAGNAIDFYLWKQGTDGGSTLGTNKVFTIDGGNDGSIGINQDTPTSTVDIRGANGAVQSRGLLYLSNNDTYGVDKGSQISFGGTYDGSANDTFFAAVAGRKENSTSGNYQGYLQFSTRETSGNNERMRITSAGNVGIGQTTPQRKLSVFKSDYPAIQLVNTTTGKTNQDGSILILEDTNMDLTIRNQENAAIRFDTNGGNERMRITAGGSVGIGTSSPTDELHLKTGDGNNPPTIRLEAGGGQFTCLIGMGNGTDTCLKSAYGLRLQTGASSDMHFYVNNSEHMAIKSTGYVGIGVSSPSSRLDVNGTVTATAFSGDGSSLTGVGTTWESKSANFTAAAATAYFVDTTSGAITATLPASPSTGDEVRFLDVAGTFDTNNLTVARNGNPIQGDASDMTVSTERAGFALVFYNSTQGWLLKDV